MNTEFTQHDQVRLARIEIYLTRLCAHLGVTLPSEEVIAGDIPVPIADPGVIAKNIAELEKAGNKKAAASKKSKPEAGGLGAIVQVEPTTEAEAPAPAEVQWTPELLNKEMVAAAKALPDGVAKVTALLAKHGVKKLNEVPEEKRQEVFSALARDVAALLPKAGA